MIGIILCILTGFAWAIGGEKYFGKWRRGMLVAIPFAIKGILMGAHWWYYPVLLFLAWASYQALFYDECIKLIWKDPNTPDTTVWQRVLGWGGLAVNGLISGFIPLALYFQAGFFPKGLIAVGILMVAFPFICWLSNGLKFKFNSICVVYCGVKLWCPEDTWWLACWIFGLILGVV